ncbi:MAG: Hpt domain-containing protein, partial [Lentisphaeria bacterium]
MSDSSLADLGAFSMMELLRQEVEAQAAILTEGVLAAERGGVDPAVWEQLMRAAHSVKGAARIVGLDAAVQVAHALEDGFSDIQHGRAAFSAAAADPWLAAVDLLVRLSKLSEADAVIWPEGHRDELEAILQRLAAARAAVVAARQPETAGPAAAVVPPVAAVAGEAVNEMPAVPPEV